MSMQTQEIPIPKLPRATFNRSKKRVGSYRKGLIYPIYCKYGKPGDHINLKYCKYGKPGDHINLKFEVVARKLPTLNPSFTEERIVVRAFTVPLRTLWKDWKNWQTGFKEYSDNVPFTEDVPRWIPSDIKKTGIKSLWKHLGFPANTLPDICPAAFKQQAYGWIYDTYFRYRPIQNTILDEGQPGTWKGEDLLEINKDRDFFTTGLPYQQLGDAVTLPITGDTKTEFLTDENALYDLFRDFPNSSDYSTQNVNLDVVQNKMITQPQGSEANPTGRIAPSDIVAENILQDLRNAVSIKKEKLIAFLKDNIVKMNNVSAATVSMIRHAFSRQLRAENLARTGVFYPHSQDN